MRRGFSSSGGALRKGSRAELFAGGRGKRGKKSSRRKQRRENAADTFSRGIPAPFSLRRLTKNTASGEPREGRGRIGSRSGKNVCGNIGIDI